MVGGVAAASILGVIGVAYSLIASAPFSITRQNTLPTVIPSGDAEHAAEQTTSTMTITIR